MNRQQMQRDEMVLQDLRKLVETGMVLGVLGNGVRWVAKHHANAVRSGKVMSQEESLHYIDMAMVKAAAYTN